MTGRRSRAGRKYKNNEDEQIVPKSADRKSDLSVNRSHYREKSNRSNPNINDLVTESMANDGKVFTGEETKSNKMFEQEHKSVHMSSIEGESQIVNIETS